MLFTIQNSRFRVQFKASSVFSHDMQARPEQVPLPQDEGNAEVEVENADLDFVNEFGGNLGFLESLNAKSLDKQIQKGSVKQTKQSAQNSGSDSDDEGPEAAYERAPRQRLQEQQSTQAAGLPIKNLLGELVYAKSRSNRPQPTNMKVLHLSDCCSVASSSCTFYGPPCCCIYKHLRLHSMCTQTQPAQTAS